MSGYKRAVVANHSPQQDAILCYKALWIALFLLLFSQLCSALVITSTLQNPAGQPVEDVTIADGRTWQSSDADGKFTINTSADTLYIAKLGFEEVRISTAHVPSVITLQYRNITLPPVKIIGFYAPPSAPALDTHTVYQDTDGKSSTAGEALRQSSSLVSPDVGLAGERQTFSILGNLNRHTVVMLDDVILSQGGEAFDFSQINMDDIARIEIIKGNTSLYGGANAIGGIVRFYSKKHHFRNASKLESELTVGSFGLQKNRFLAEIRNKGRYFSLAYSGYSADNDFPYKPRPWWNLSGDLKRENNSKQADVVNMSIGFNDDYLSMGYAVNSESYARSLPGPVNFLALYDNAVMKGNKLHQNVQMQYLQGEVSEMLTVWLNNDFNRYKNLESTNPIYLADNQHKQQSLGLKSQTGIVHGQYKLDYLAEISSQSFGFTDWMYGQNNVPRQDRSSVATSIRAEDRFDFRWGDYTLAGGLRYDGVEGFDGFPSWRVEQQIKLQSRADIQLGHSIGTAFALPSFYDLYWKGDTQSMGNPDLKPETSRGQSLWSSLGFERLTVKASLHQNRIDDLIQWRQVYFFGTVWKPVNISAAEITSKEIEVEYHPWIDWTLSGSATGVTALDKSKDDSGLPTPAYNKRLIYTPDWRLNGRLAKGNSWSGCDVSCNYTGKQYSTADNLIEPLPAVLLWNASAYAKVQYKRVELSAHLKANNVFDKQYEVYVYVPQPGFNWQSSLEFRFEM